MALQLRDAVLRLRRDGAFVAVPLFRVNMEPIGPHPVGEHRFHLPPNPETLRCISPLQDHMRSGCHRNHSRLCSLISA